MLVAPVDYTTGLDWLNSLSSCDPEVRRQAKNFPPRKFSGNTDTYYGCPDISDDRIFLSADRGWPDNLICKITDIYNQRVPLKLDKKASRFIRDSAVPLFPKGCLIPYSIKDPIFLNLFLAMLPSTANQFIIEEAHGKTKYKMPFGRGYKIENTISTMKICYENHIPFQRARTCIEGGNCFVFMSKGRKKAIIGNHSIFLSIIALEEQNMFEDMDQSEMPEPSLDSIRIARNLHLYERKREHDFLTYSQKKKMKEGQVKQSKEQNGHCETAVWRESVPEQKVPLPDEEAAYRRSLISPLTEEEKNRYFEDGKMVEAIIRKTKRLMAQDLGIDEKDVAFIPQTQFHIDMELFVLPEGRVVLHDPEKVEGFLEPIRQQAGQNGDSLDLLNAYVSNAKKEAAKNREIRERRIEILRAHQIDIETLPAIFKASKFNSHLNHCNGIFMEQGFHIVAQLESGERCFGKMKGKSSCFVTTGPSTASETQVHHHFVELFGSTFENYFCKGIEGMSEFVKKYRGGIRCLSFSASPGV